MRRARMLYNATFVALPRLPGTFLHSLLKKKALIVSAVLIFTQIFPVVPAIVYAASSSVAQVGSSASLDPVANKADRLQSQGSSGVDQTSGAFTYSYPIKLPEGRGGMTPTLVASYNSQNNESGPLGYGWNLSVPYIERVNKAGSDKLYTDPSFVSSLHGELTTNDGTSYEQKIDDGSFAKYTFNGISWQMTDRDGTTYYFGNTAQSKLQNESGSQVGRWYLAETRDKFGNSISYTYIKDSNNIYPNTISYTEHALAHAPYVVSFSYDTKPDQTVSYKYSFRVVDTKRLNTIQIAAFGTDVAYLNFAYTTGSNGARSLLSSVTERRLGDNGDWSTIPPTTFEYEKSAISFSGTIQNTSNPYGSNTVIDTNSDGIPELYNAGADFFPIDINGDYKKDLLQSTQIYGAYQGTSNVTFKYNLGSSFEQKTLLSSYLSYQRSLPQGWPAPPTRVSPEGSGTWKNQATVADVNGDGFDDIVINDEYGVNTVAVNTKANTFDYSKPSNFTIDINNDQLADVNNDGLLDKITKTYTSTSTIYSVRLNTGTGYATTTAYQYDAKIGSTPYDNGVRFTDVNNDGLVDVVRSYRSTYKDSPCSNFFGSTGTIPVHETVNELYINTGSSFVASSSTLNGYLAFYSGCPDGYGNNLSYQSSKEYDTNGDLTTDYDNSINQTKKQDVLKKVTTSLGSTLDVGYTWSTSSGLNPGLPIPLALVSTTTERLTISDPLPHTVSYTFASGTVYFDETKPTDHRVAGFGRVDVLDGNKKTVTYFHQGNGDDYITGEKGDSYYAIGKPYRTDVYDVSSPTSPFLVSKNISLYTTYSTASSSFTYIDSQVNNIYASSTSWVSSASKQTYDVGTRLIKQSVDYGDIEPFTSFASSTISDQGTDIVTTDYQYSNTRPQRLVKEISKDYAGNNLSNSTYYYDGLPYGLVDKGAQTSVAKNIYNGDGTLSASTTESVTYDAVGNPVQTVDPLGRAVKVVYDVNQFLPIQKIDPANGTTTFTYNPITLNLSSTRGPDGVTIFQEVDGFGNLTHSYETSTGGGNVNEVKNFYLYGNGLTVTSKRLGASGAEARSTKSYDGYGRLIQNKTEISTDKFITEVFQYDAQGNRVRSSLPYTSTGFGLTDVSSRSSDITFTYDAMGRVATKTTGDLVTSYSYGPRTLTVSDNSSTQHKKTYTYDARSNLSQVVEYNGVTPYTTSYSYTPTGKLSRITDAKGNIRNFTYLSNGLLSYQEDPHPSADTTYTSYTYTYDPAGRLTQKSGPLGTISYSYDVIDRPTVRSVYDSNNGTSTVSISYTGCSNTYTSPCVIDRGTSSTTLAYNQFGRLQNETMRIDGKTFTRSYGYDTFLNPTTITYPDNGQAVYTYSLDGRQSSLAYITPQGVTKPIISNTEWNDQGQVSSLAFGNGVYQCNTYTTTSTDGAITPHLSKSEYLLNTYGCNNGTANAVSLYKDDISYKDTFTPSSILSTYKDIAGISHTKQDSFTYDNLARLTGVSSAYDGSASINKTLAYDPVGNLLQEDDVLYSYSTDGMQNAHAATSIGGTHLAYDSQGNRLQVGDDAYSWNVLNQLTLASSTNGTESYTYDENGERIKKVVSANRLINQKITPATATSSTYGYSQGYFLTKATGTLSLVSTNSLVSYYKLDESSGNASDSSGNGKTLTNVGAMGYAAAQINNGVITDSGNRRLSSSEALGFNGADSSNTWSFWVKMNSNGGYFMDNLVSNKMRLLIYGNGTGLTMYLVSTTNPAATISSSALSNGAWYHVAVVNNSGNFTFYINGVSQGSTGTLSNGTAGGSQTYFSLGAAGDGFGANTNATFDELGLWSRALSSTEIANLYNNGTGLAYPFTTTSTTYVASSTYNALSAMQMLSTSTVSNLVNSYYSSPFVSEYCKTGATVSVRQLCAASTTEQLIANNISARIGSASTTVGLVSDLIQITKNNFLIPPSFSAYSSSSSSYIIASSSQSLYTISSTLISAYSTYVATGIVIPVTTYSNLPLISTSTYATLASLGLADNSKIVALFSLAGCTATSTQCATPSKVIFERYYKNNGVLLSNKALSEMWYVFAGKARIPTSPNEYSSTAKYLSSYTTASISGITTTTSTSTYYANLYYTNEYNDQLAKEPRFTYFNVTPYYVTQSTFSTLNTAGITQTTIDNYSNLIQEIVGLTRASSTEYMLALKLFVQYDKKVTLSDSVLKELYLVTIGAAAIPNSVSDYIKYGVYDITNNLIVSSAKTVNGQFVDVWTTDCNAGWVVAYSKHSRCLIKTSSTGLVFSTTTSISYILSITTPPAPTENQLYIGESSNTSMGTDSHNYPVDLPYIFNFSYNGTTTPDNHRRDVDVTATVVAQQASSTVNKTILLANPGEWTSYSYPWQASTLTLKAYTTDPQMTLASTTLTSFATTTIATSTDTFIKNTISAYFGEIYDSSSQVQLPTLSTGTDILYVSPESYAEFASTTLRSANDISKIFLATTTSQCVPNASTTECDKQVRINFFRETVGNLSGFVPSQAATEEFWMVHKGLLQLPYSTATSSAYNIIYANASSTGRTYSFGQRASTTDSSSLTTSTYTPGCSPALYDNAYDGNKYNYKCFVQINLNEQLLNGAYATSTLYVPGTITVSSGAGNFAQADQVKATILTQANYWPTSTSTVPGYYDLPSITSDQAGYLAYNITDVISKLKRGEISGITLVLHVNIYNPDTSYGNIHSVSETLTGDSVVQIKSLTRSFNRLSLPSSLSTTTSSFNSTTTIPGYGEMITRSLMAPAGGSVTTSGTYTIQTLTSSTTLNVTDPFTAEMLMIGGGGAGNNSGNYFNAFNGGGGAGQFLHVASTTISSGSYSLVVGSGGLSSGANGATSTFNGYAAIGGSGTSNVNGGSSGNGFSGGSGNGNTGGAGGGGSSGVGQDGCGSSGGTCGGQYDGADGGAGTSNSITGSSVIYACGGAGDGYANSGFGNGSFCTTYGSGGNGGGSGGVWSAGKNGVIILRYLTSSFEGSTTTYSYTATSTIYTPITHLDLVPRGLLNDLQFRSVYSTSSFALATTTMAISEDTYNELLNTPIRVDSDVISVFTYAYPYATSSCPGESATSSCVISAQKAKVKSTVGTLSGFLLSDAALEELYRVNNNQLTILYPTVSSATTTQVMQDMVIPLSAQSVFTTFSTTTVPTTLFTQTAGVCTFGTQTSTSSRCYITFPHITNPLNSFKLMYDFATSSVATSTALMTLTSSSTATSTTLTGTLATSTLTYDLESFYRTNFSTSTTKITITPNDIASSTLYTVTNPHISLTRRVTVPHVTYSAAMSAQAMSRSEIASFATSTGTTTSDLTSVPPLELSMVPLSPFASFDFSIPNYSTTSQISSVATTNLISYWKLDDSLSDSAGSVTLTPVNSPSYATGKINNGRQYTGGSNRDQFSYNSAIPSGSVSFWFKYSGISANFGRIFSKTQAGVTDAIIIAVNTSNKLQVHINDSADLNTNASTLSTDTWYHYVVKWDGSNVKIYKNGTLETNTASTKTIQANSQPYYIGGTDVNTQGISGVVDELGLWSRTLSDSEVLSLYNSGNGSQYPFSVATTTQSMGFSTEPSYVYTTIATSSLVSYYKLESNSTDSVGTTNGSDSGVSYSSSYGKIGNGGYYNNNAASNLGTAINLPGAMTVSAWIKSADVSSWSPVVSDRAGSCAWGQYSLDLGITGSGKFSLGWGNGNTAAVYESSSSVLTNNTWAHLVATRDSSNNVALYLNGSPVSASFIAGDTSTAIYSSPQGTMIGRDGSCVVTGYFNGGIDEVSLWSRVLSASEVAALYNSGVGNQYPFTVAASLSGTSSSVLSSGYAFIPNSQMKKSVEVSYYPQPSVTSTSSPSAIVYPYATSSVATSTVNTLTVATTTSYTVYTPFSGYQDDSRGTVTTYLTFNGQLVGTYTYDKSNPSGGKVTYLLTNYLGTPVLATDDHGDIVEMDITDVFGNYVQRDVKKDNAEHTRGFTNQDFDDVTGLNYFHARYLDTKAHTFLSVDPMLYKIPESYLTDPQQMNSYAYARNNPVVYTDPTGEFALLLPALPYIASLFMALPAISQFANAIIPSLSTLTSLSAQAGQQTKQATSFAGKVIAGAGIIPIVPAVGNTASFASKAGTVIQEVKPVIRTGVSLAEQMGNKSFSSFGALKSAVNEQFTVPKGIDLHHIVEQGGANAKQFTQEMLQNTKNIVPLFQEQHREITRYFGSKTVEGFSRTRDFVRSMSFDDQFTFGQEILDLFK